MTSAKSTFLDLQNHDKDKVDFDQVDKGKIIGISSIETLPLSLFKMFYMLKESSITTEHKSIM